MNKQEEKHLIDLIKAGDNNARRKMIEALYPKCKYIAKDYVNENISFEDLTQEASEAMVKIVNNVESYNLSSNRLISIVNKAMRNKVKTFVTNHGNNISHSKYNVLQKSVGKFIKAITHSYDTQMGNYGTGLDFLGEWDMRSRMSLHNIFLDIFDEFLTFEQSDLIRLHYGFAHEHFDDWQKPQKALSLRVIANKYNIGVKRVRDEMDKAMIILRSDEVKYKLDGF